MKFNIFLLSFTIYLAFSYGCDNVSDVTKTSDNLGGKNTPMRRGSARSSRAHSANFQKLRKLDRAIGKIDWDIKFSFSKEISKKLNLKRVKLDETRKTVRTLLKKYEAPNHT